MHTCIPKRPLLLLLAAMLLLSGCSSDGTETIETTATPTTEQTAKTRVPHGLPALDFQGAHFHTTYLDWQEYAEYFFAHESTGDAMNDAIFDRTTRVEEALNVSMTETAYVKSAYLEQANAVKASVQAGDDAYQMALLFCFDYMLTEGYLHPVDTMPYIDLDAPWWNREAMDSLRPGKHYYYCVSDYTIPVPFAVYFNKDMVKNYALSDPYTLVREGKWTMDTMFDMGLAVAQDVDGDGKYTEGDVVGIAAHVGSQYINFMTGAGQFVGTKTDDGTITIDMNNERMYTIIDKFYQYLIQPCALLDTPESTWDDPYGMLGGKALFRLNSIALGHHYRDVEENIGILPYPKLDEAQEDYISLNWGGLMGIPVSIRDPEMVGAVIELLAWESGDTVIPAYYDVLLDGKLARDEDSVAMLDLLFDSFIYDPGLNLLGSKPGVTNLVWTMSTLVASQRSTDFASYYAQNEKAALHSVAEFYEALAQIES